MFTCIVNLNRKNLKVTQYRNCTFHYFAAYLFNAKGFGPVKSIMHLPPTIYASCDIKHSQGIMAIMAGYNDNFFLLIGC